MRLSVLVALLPVSLAAQPAAPPDPLDALVRDSPFLPSGASPRAPSAGEGGPLELRSVVVEGGEYAFSIYDQGSHEAKWVKLNQEDLPFVAKSFDDEQEILSVEYQGRTLALKLQPAHTAGAAPTGPGGPPPPLPSPDDAARQAGSRPQNAGQSNGQPVPVQPAPGALKPEESQRLQQMAEEIRRRRAQPPQLPGK
ncbi:MAG TPA: hypothetical protein VG734_13470 [Lacunisphaera sp.]|nr:hypothetical protein [Lacunisphaera sp.]